MTGRESQTLCQALAIAIREASTAGKLVGKQALLAELRDRSLTDPDVPGAPDMEVLLAEALAANADLAALTSITGEVLYHAPQLLSRTYAGILDSRSSPVRLIAEEVRRNSAEYPRPLPIELFEQSPFDLTSDQIEAGLKTLADDPEFGDISFVTTSTGAVYLFSSRHLERSYAAFLAERADTGLLMNP